ncbi:MAG: NADP-dependent phosphogluconate dehydrogenase [Chloroflexota bacterium]|nr:NADP-dependent phosphogluconate dehydrogenase [Chloroflexota bacterium]
MVREGGSPRSTGVIGLAVMGENLALNIERNGFPISVYNRTDTRTKEFMAERAEGLNVHAAYTIEEFVKSLERPRRIVVMVKAGAPVDAVIAELDPYLEDGDIIVDGGNSFFHDTERRARETESRPYDFVGMGVSGGEEGALWGPSIMPGGPVKAWTILEPMLTAIAAKTEHGACVTHCGPGGAGHYVKMVHNGIEYGDMQLIAETYDIMKRALGMSPAEMAEVFGRWNEGKLSSFLIEITAKVLSTIDPITHDPLVEKILDAAEQKGTGRWTSQNALELGTPIPVIDAAVFARSISSFKARRVGASKILKGPNVNLEIGGDEKNRLIGVLEDALYVSKISSYAQGMALLRAASDAYAFGLNLSELARIWTGGCIIRARLLEPIMTAFRNNVALDNLLLAPEFVDTVNSATNACREAVVLARMHGLPCPAMSAALDFIDSYRTERLPANLIQGLRDFFGAHTYKRIDTAGTYHANWETGAAEEIPG